MLNEQIFVNAIGTPSAPATLTAAYTGNVYRLGAIGFRSAFFKVRYTPAALQTNRYLYMLLEGSDDGVNYDPIAIKVVSTDQIDILPEDLDGNIGIPYLFPGDLTSTGGVTYKGMFQSDPFSFKYLKLSFKESDVANFGTVSVQLSLTTL